MSGFVACGYGGLTERWVPACSWAANCAVRPGSNGADLKDAKQRKTIAPEVLRDLKYAKADVVKARGAGYPLPAKFAPTLKPIKGENGTAKYYILPDGKTGVVRRLVHIASIRGRV